MAYVLRALSKHKPATLVVSIEERENAKVIKLRLQQREQFGEEMGNRSVNEDVLSPTICIVEQSLNARPFTPVISDRYG